MDWTPKAVYAFPWELLIGSPLPLTKQLRLVYVLGKCYAFPR